MTSGTPIFGKVLIFVNFVIGSCSARLNDHRQRSAGLYLLLLVTSRHFSIVSHTEIFYSLYQNLALKRETILAVLCFFSEAVNSLVQFRIYKFIEMISFLFL